MIDNLINEIEQAMLNVLDNEQLSLLRKVLEYTFRNVSVTEKDSVHTGTKRILLYFSNNKILEIKKVEEEFPYNLPTDSVSEKFYLWAKKNSWYDKNV